MLLLISRKVDRRLHLHSSTGTLLWWGRAALTFHLASLSTLSPVWSLRYEIFLHVTDLASFMTKFDRN